MLEKIIRSEEQWRDRLSPEEYRVTREAGTESAFSGHYYDHHDSGSYQCRCCGLELFHSKAKYDSGSGWPSFFQPVNDDHLQRLEDRSHFMARTEVLCARCDAHLGHRFGDGPQPTGLRYCVNSTALEFVAEK